MHLVFCFVRHLAECMIQYSYPKKKKSRTNGTKGPTKYQEKVLRKLAFLQWKEIKKCGEAESDWIKKDCSVSVTLLCFTIGSDQQRRPV